MNANICRFCNGLGYDEERFKKHIGNINILSPYDILCRKCYGTGELDWVEEMVGKKISIAKRILAHTKISEILKRAEENEYQQKLQAFYEGCVPI